MIFKNARISIRELPKSEANLPSDEKADFSRILESELLVNCESAKATNHRGTFTCTVPVDTDRVLKQAPLNCAEKYFDDEEKHGLPMLAAMATIAEFSISSRAKKTNTIYNYIISEMLRVCVSRGVHASREYLEKNLGYESRMALRWHCRCNSILARRLACGDCPPAPDLLLIHPELSAILIYYSL